MKEISFILNKKKIHLKAFPMERLLDSLRNAGYTGTKEGCGEGECGACSVIMNGQLVNSCLIPFIQAENTEITTIEGLNQNEILNPLQESFLKWGGTQCGICTPGMLLAGTTLIKDNPHPSVLEIKEGLAGNFCRCTGHSKIINSIKKLTSKECENEGLCSKL